MKRFFSRPAWIIFTLAVVSGLLEAMPSPTLLGQVVGCNAFPQGCYKKVAPPCDNATCAAATPAMAQTFCGNAVTHPVYYSAAITNTWYECSLLKGSGKLCQEYNDGQCANIQTYDRSPCGESSRCGKFVLYQCIADVGVPCT